MLREYGVKSNRVKRMNMVVPYLVKRRISTPLLQCVIGELISTYALLRSDEHKFYSFAITSTSENAISGPIVCVSILIVFDTSLIFFSRSNEFPDNISP